MKDTQKSFDDKLSELFLWAIGLAFCALTLTGCFVWIWHITHVKY